MKHHSSIPRAFRGAPLAADIESSARTRSTTLQAVEAVERARRHLSAVALTIDDWSQFSGLSDLLRAVLPESRAGKEDVAVALALHPADLEFLARGRITPLDVNPDTVIRLADLLGLAAKDALQLVQKDMARPPGKDGLPAMPAFEAAVRMRKLRAEFRTTERQQGR